MMASTSSSGAASSSKRARRFALAAAAGALALAGSGAQAQDLTGNLTSLTGTWSSGSGAVLTGPVSVRAWLRAVVRGALLDEGKGSRTGKDGRQTTARDVVYGQMQFAKVLQSRWEGRAMHASLAQRTMAGSSQERE